MERKVIAYKNYFLDFYKAQNDTVQRKIEWTLKLIETTYKVPEKYFKHITGPDGIYEIRVEVGSNIYRIFSFFDKGNLVVYRKWFSKENSEDSQK